MMRNKIELIGDGHGLAVIGNHTAVEGFLDSVGLLSLSKDLGLDRLGSVLTAGAVVAEKASQIAANAGLYLKLTPESAQLVKELGLMETKTPGISYAMLGNPGKIGKWLKIDSGPGAFVTNPAVLSGLAGIMAQVATQQTMAEITDYLATIVEQVDDVLRKQDDAEVAKLVGVGHAIDRAMIIREETVEINATLWSTVADSHQTIGAAQKFALDQLDAIARKLESTRVGGLAKTTKQAETNVPKWLAVLARCFQLEDAIDVLELDRVLIETPEKVDAYDRGMKRVRKDRQKVISEHTTNLLDRMDAAVRTANAKMVWSLNKSLEVIESTNHLGTGIQDFHGLLTIESDPRTWEARRLGSAMDFGSQAIQKSKDAAPIVVAGLGAAGLIGFASKVFQEEETTEES
jgi:rRNA processing protein Krr1/Pno1